ncbi:hypothetical protein LTR08_005380 [Meristemomyces frigidus]|nr:hypothetical protein LTR08_005380 [Meristemomyces frigidus]
MAYLAPIHRPSSVRHAIKLAFIAPDADDLIVAKANRLEIWAASPQQPDQLVLQHTRAVYGKVTLLHKLRPAASQTDHLFVATDRYHYFTLSWDAATQQLKTEASYVDVAEKAARDSQTGDRVAIDPTGRFMALECYEGVVNILPIAHAAKGKRKAADSPLGELQPPVPVRVPDLFVKSSCFLHKRQAGARPANPELALLHEDQGARVRLTVRELEFTPSLRPQEEPPTVELDKAREAQGELELGASHLIALPAPMYGLLVVGETSISYVEEWEYLVSATQPLAEATVFVAWCAVDAQRYCLADDYGRLYLLFVQQNAAGEYAGHQLDVLGETSRASVLVYLDAGRIFVGSHQGDSQVVQISGRKSVEILQTFANIAPILDFTVMDMGNRSSDAVVNEFSSGQARIVTGSGAYKDGSLRSVRSGVGLEDLGSLGEMGAPVSAMFSLRSSASTSAAVDTLVVSFVSHTRVFRFAADGEVEEVEVFAAFALAESTLHAGNLPDGRVVQVTGSAVQVSDNNSNSTPQSSWHPSPDSTITAVAAQGNHLLLSLSGATLLALDLSAPTTIRLQARRAFPPDEQISCIALSPALPNTCFAGSWAASKVALLDLATLQPLATARVASDENDLAVPRSLVVAQLLPHEPPTLFIGLADGNVVTYSVISPSEPFTNRKTMMLGTQQPNFALLPRADGLQNIFATCEHPSLIYGAEGRTVYSAVTAAAHAQSICAFDCAAYPGAIAIATAEAEIRLAAVDEERTTHVQTLPVGATVRRIAYSSALKAFGLGTITRTLVRGEEVVQSHFALVDEVAFATLDSYALDEDELVECCMRCALDDGSGAGGVAERFVVGTSFLAGEEGGEERMRGRILVFEVVEGGRRLKVLSTGVVRGGVRCLGFIGGEDGGGGGGEGLLAWSKRFAWPLLPKAVLQVVVYALEYQTPSTPFLVKKATYRTATAPIDLSVTGTTIAVADLMKSLSLLTYTPARAGAPESLTEVARHFDTLWSTAVAQVAEHTYLEADAEGNLVVLEHDVAGYSEDDRRRLRVVGDFRLGEMVNRIRAISVQPSADAVVVPRAFLATVEGSIYLFALIAPAHQDLLMQLQLLLAERVVSLGGVPFAGWRGLVRGGGGDSGGQGPTRFVDGEVVEGFLGLGREGQEEVCGVLGVGVEVVRGVVEGLRRVR